ncbi:MAG: helix-turn-helix domain-containing protein [Magnetococcus sp. YQC-3]
MNKHKGSTLDLFLAEEAILDEVSSRAKKRLLALQLADIMREKQLTKTHLARQLHTSRAQLDRLLDPENVSITLESMQRLAQAVGRELRIEFA